MVRRTKEDALETRAHLLDSAGHLFGLKGVANTSMAQVAEHAGVTRGAIYHHFCNKQDLIESMMDSIQLPVDDMRKGIADLKDGDVLQEIQQRTFQFLLRFKEDKSVQTIAGILMHKCEYVDEVNPIKLRHVNGRNECIDDFELLFKKAVDNGQLSEKVNTRMAVIGLFSLVDGLIYNWLLDSSYYDIAECGIKAVNVYLDGLAARHK